MDYTIVCCDDTGYNKKLFQCLLHDLSEDSKTKVIYKNICMPTLLKKIIFWRMPNRVDSRFLRYEIDKIIKSKKDKYQGINLILFNIATRYYDANKIELLKSMYPMLKIYLWIIDPIDMAASMSNTLHLIDNHYELLDGIWINDDSENVLKRTKAKFQYSPYSIISKYSNLFDSAKYDVYWGGVVKGRISLLKDLVSAFKSNDICFKIDAYTWGKKAEEIDVIGRLKPRKEFVAYDVILERTLAANVIIDIVDNNAPITLRAYEAVVYDKKLLTNNKKILEFKYYDRRYIQYFEKVEDINWDWVKESVNVNYSYTGDFSPAGVIPLFSSCQLTSPHTTKKIKKNTPKIVWKKSTPQKNKKRTTPRKWCEKRAHQKK